MGKNQAIDLVPSRFHGYLGSDTAALFLSTCPYKTE